MMKLRVLHGCEGRGEGESAITSEGVVDDEVDEGTKSKTTEMRWTYQLKGFRL